MAQASKVDLGRKTETRGLKCVFYRRTGKNEYSKIESQKSIAGLWGSTDGQYVNFEAKCLRCWEFLTKPMIEMHGGLIVRKQRAQKRESHKRTVKIEPFVAIGENRLFGLLDVHFAQSKGPSYLIFDWKLAIQIERPQQNQVKDTEPLKVCGDGCQKGKMLRWMMHMV